jgi:UMF1 family MFS transporter
MTSSSNARRPLLERLGLHRRELRAWAMYDWAISAFQTTIAVAVFPIFFLQVAGAGAEGTLAAERYAVSNSVSIAIVALLSPVLGTIADYSAAKKRMLGLFLGLGVASCGAMYFIRHGDLTLAAVLFVLASVAAAASTVFYEALLPHVARPDEVDRVSSAGYAIGYFGGGLLLALNLGWIMAPGAFGLPSGPDLTPSQQTLPVRLAFVSVGVWWLLFSLPLFRRVPEPARAIEADESPRENPVRVAFVRLGETLTALRGYKQAFVMLLAFLIYNDGIATIQRMATAYGTEIGFPRDALITAILLVQFIGVPCTLLFGLLAGWLGTKRTIFVGLAIYLVISVLGYYMQTVTHFYLLAILVGLVQGGTQALSRSLFANLIPKQKSGEFFGFYSVFNKFAGIFGPLLFAGVINRYQSSRPAILSVSVMFVVGGALLALVDVEAGERAARQAEATQPDAS